MLPFTAGRKRAWLFQQDVVEVERQSEDGFEFEVKWTSLQKARFDAL